MYVIIINWKYLSREKNNIFYVFLLCSLKLIGSFLSTPIYIYTNIFVPFENIVSLRDKQNGF